MDFEMYNMGHLITAACVHQRATGKSNLMKLALKAADFLDETFKNPRPEQARHGICPAHLMALVEHSLVQPRMNAESFNGATAMNVIHVNGYTSPDEDVIYRIQFN